ncbi:hypothetical protein HDK77DRAFT_132422 [Phyllosticta capitalensis]|uniref:Uncharacterized protein n=1 Tax=Phyllosticta capitalensis TaxID=121624 RepID=A0ABR1Z1V8_9PEZI
MAGAHQDAAAAMRILGSFFAVAISITAAYRQVWPPSPAPPAGPKTVVHEDLPFNYFQPGGLSRLGMCTYGDFLHQAAYPVPVQPQSTYADLLLSLFINGTRCSPSEAPIPYDSARFFRVMAESGFDHVFSNSIRIFLDLFTTAFPLVDSSLSPYMVLLWVFLAFNFAHMAFVMVHEFLMSWTCYFLYLVFQWAKSTLICAISSWAKPYMLGFLRGTSLQDHFEGVIMILCPFLGSIILECLHHQFPIFSLDCVGTFSTLSYLLGVVATQFDNAHMQTYISPMQTYVLELPVAPRTALDTSLRLKLLSFLVIPAYGLAFPGHSTIDICLLIDAIGCRESYTIVSRLFPKQIIFHATIQTLKEPNFHACVKWGVALFGIWISRRFGVVGTLLGRARWC